MRRMPYDGMEAEAARVGRKAVRCRPCQGTGVAVGDNITSPSGKRTTDPCDGCRGSGRMWCVAWNENIPDWRRDDEVCREIGKATLASVLEPLAPGLRLDDVDDPSRPRAATYAIVGPDGLHMATVAVAHALLDGPPQRVRDAFTRHDGVAHVRDAMRRGQAFVAVLTGDGATVEQLRRS
jgi:hypothetical protein